MKQIAMKRLYQFCLFLGVTAVLLGGLLAPSLLTAQAVAAPSFTLKAVVPGGLVYVTGSNFPTSTTFTVRMGAAGTQGVGGQVVAHFDTASTAASPTYVFEIPVTLRNAAAIDLRAEAGSVVVLLTFNNQAFTLSSGGSATGLTLSIVSVVQGGKVTVKVSNMPAGVTFTALMGPAGSQGLGGQVAAHFESGAGGSRTVLLGIPVTLSTAATIDLRIEAPGGAIAYINFVNQSTAVSPVGVGGASAITIVSVQQGGIVKATFNHMPAGLTLTEVIAPVGTGGVGGKVVGHVDTGAGGSSTHILEIPVSLRTNAQLEISLKGPNYVVMTTFNNVNYP